MWCNGERESRPKIIFQWCTPSGLLATRTKYGVVKCAQRAWAQGGLRLREWSVSFFGTLVRARHEFDGPEFAEMFETISVLQVHDCAPPLLPHNEATSLDDALDPGARHRSERCRRVARLPRFQSETALPANIGQNPDVRPWLHCTVQTLLRNIEFVLIRSGNLSVGDNYETTRC